MATKIYLSPSSQSDNNYSYGNWTEAQVCRKIAEYAKSALERNGFSVKLAKEGLNIQQRIAESNDWGTDVHQPIHTNAGGGDGTLVMCYTGCANDKYVKNVYTSVSALTPTKDDGIRVNTGIAEITGTVAMCPYLEVEFHDNSTTAKWIVNNMRKIGEAIAKGYCKAEGKTYKSGSNTEAGASHESGILWRVQVGAYRDSKNASARAEQLNKHGFDSYVYLDAGVYKVQAGAFTHRQLAVQRAEELKKAGFETYIYKK